MSRFKFRAWDKFDKQMLNVSKIYWLDDGSINAFWCDIENPEDPEDEFAGKYLTKLSGVLMQSTGKFDKNGVEIFEGDIIKPPYGSLHQVVYDEESVSLMLYKRHYFESFEDFYPLSSLEVVGNIYEDSRNWSFKDE